MGIVLFFVLLYFLNTTGTYDTYAYELDTRFGFMVTGKDANSTAPVWLSEFGVRSVDLLSEESVITRFFIRLGIKGSTDAMWWDFTQQYLRDREIHWAYWCLNGERRNGEEEAMGLLDADMETVRYQSVVDQLK